MELFINESLGLYPRHPGDIRLIDPEWEDGKPLPEGWEEVIATEPPQVAKSQYWVEVAPVKVDGVWHREFEVKTYTQEELDEMKAINTPTL
jgi:hypothetical protein